MELPVLERFCIYDMRIGSITLGIINSMLTMFLSVIMIEFAKHFRAIAEEQLKRGEDATIPVVYTIVILLAALLIIKFVVDWVLVYAVYKENIYLVKKYCIFWVIFLVFFIIGFLKTLFHMDAIYVLAQVAFIAENFYYIIVIRSYLVSVNEGGVL